MEYLKYNPKLGGQEMKCTWCGQYRVCWQHHVDRKMNSDLIVWLCHPCHMKSHDKIDKAKELGVYRELTSTREVKQKQIKDKKGKCSHKKCYITGEGKKCQLCGKIVKL